MSVQRLFQTRWLTELGLCACRYLPRWAGYAVAGVLAWIISLIKPAMYKVVVSNLSHVLGPGASARDLRQAARHVFKHAGRTYYDFYNALSRSEAYLRTAVAIPQDFQDLVRGEVDKGHGVLILALHASNFDLAALTLGAIGFHCQALTLRNPPGGFGILNRVRERAGHEMTPISPSSLRKAIRRLKEGGIVVSGMDHPVYEDGVTAQFFGAPAFIPLGSARLALMTDATVIVAEVRWERKTGYSLRFVGPVEMSRSGDREADVRANTALLAQVAEELIAQCPEQWLMFYPMWEDGLALRDTKEVRNDNNG